MVNSQLCFAQTPTAVTLPTGGSIAAGQATISQTAGRSSAVMDIHQSSQKAIINWNSFDVGKNATVNFHQPNAQASTLNRVNSASQSMINGAVNASGQVIFVNPNGVVFGQGAEVNVGSLVATTMNIKDSDYMNGNYSFSGNGSGRIINRGNIKVNHVDGYIALMAPEVRNEGIISATLSSNNVVALLAGEKVTLTINNGQMSSYRVDAAAINALIKNKRLIQVSGGQVMIAANSVSDLKASVINNTGAIKADGFSQNGGQISIVASTVNQSGTVSANSDTSYGGQINIMADTTNFNSGSNTTAIGYTSGGQISVGKSTINTVSAQLASSSVNVVQNARIDASTSNGLGGAIALMASTVSHHGVINANSQNGVGGRITLAGDQISLESISLTTATGAQGGGQILVGKTRTYLAQSTYIANIVNIASGAVLDVSASQNGDGGTIQIWSLIRTYVAGTLLARGGGYAGNGGIIDTSSTSHVSYGSSLVVDTTAPRGRTGNWITDPLQLIIDTNAANVISNALATTNVTLDATQTICGGFGICTSGVGSPSITFLAGADIYSSNPNTSLILNAVGGTIDVNNNITTAQVFAVAQAITVNGSINTNGGSNSSIYLAGAILNILGNLNSNGNSNTNNGNTNSNNLNSANTTTGNNRRNGLNGLSADTNIYTSNGGMINLLATGNISIGNNSYISANGLNGGNINIVSSGGNINHIGLTDSVGKVNRGGDITIASLIQTQLINSLISTEGLTQGGVINLGQINNLGNGSTLAPPINAPPSFISFINHSFSAAQISNNSIISSSIILDSQTGVNASNGNITVYADQIQINESNLIAPNGTITIGRPSFESGALASFVAISSSNLVANQLETSGRLFGTQNVTVTARSWLLDPTNITITGTASTGGTLASALSTSGVSNILNTDIQTAINGGTSVNVVASGSITQSAALVFTTAGTPTLTIDNRSGSNQGITTSASITDNSTTGSVSLKILSAGGQLQFGSSINVKGDLTIDNTYAVNGTASGFINYSNGMTYASSVGTVGIVTLSSGANLTAGGAITINSVVNQGYGLQVLGASITAGTNINISAVAASTTHSGYSGFVVSSNSKFIAGNSLTIYAVGENIGINAQGSGIVFQANNGSINLTGIAMNSAAFSAVYLVESTGTSSPAPIIINAKTDVNINAYQPVSSTSFNSLNTRLTQILSGGNTTLSAYGGNVGVELFYTSTYAGGALTIQGLSSTLTTQNGNPQITVVANSSVVGATQGIYIDSQAALTVSSTGSPPNSGTYTGLNAVGNISLYGSGAGTASAITIGTPINSTGGALTLTGTGLSSGIAVATTSNGTLTGNSIFVTGNSATASTVVSLAGAMTINSGTVSSTSDTSHDLVIIGNNSAAGSNTGISVTGNITDGASGGYIQFKSNNSINQTGAITMVANTNTSGRQAKLSYDTTYGNSTSTTTTGSFSILGGSSTNAISYLIKSSGARITVGGAINVPGFILLDNTYGPSGATAVSGGITSANATTAGTLATSSTGVTINAALTAGTYTGTTSGYNTVSSCTSSCNQATLSGIVINGVSSTGQAVNNASSTLTSAGGIYVTGSGTTAASLVTLNGPMILNTSGNLNVYSNNNLPGSANAIVSSGTITDNVNGGSINFYSNNSINQTGAITMVANTSGSEANVTYNTTYGNQTSTTTGGSLTIAGTSSSAINYRIKSAGAPITISGAINVPGYILLDNTYGPSGSGAVSGGITSANATTAGTLATSSTGITINSGLTAGSFPGTVSGSAVYGIVINGISSTGQAVNNASSTLTSAGGIYVTGSGTTAASLVTLNGPMVLNTSGNLNVYSNNNLPGSASAIVSSGTITDNVNGGSINFYSNNSINQTGAITMVANTSGTASNVTYNTTYGNQTSTTTAGSLTITGTSTSAINYRIKSAGAPITITNSINVPGYILLDNTYGPSGSPATSGYLKPSAMTISNTTSSNGITINGALTAGSLTTPSVTYAGIVISGASTTGQAVYDASSTLTSSNGISITGYGLTAATIVTLNGAMVLNTAGDLSIIANNAAGGANTGITSSGAITDNVSGGNITFKSNNSITQTGSIAFAANTGSTEANIKYDTTWGNKLSKINIGLSTSTIGSISFTSGSIMGTNLQALAAGAYISIVNAINVPGYILLDNTYGGCSGCTTANAGNATQGYINLANASTLATGNDGIVIKIPLSTGKVIAQNVSNTSSGVTINSINYQTDNTSGAYNAITIKNPIIALKGDIKINAQSDGTYGGAVYISPSTSYGSLAAIAGNISIAGATNSSSHTGANNIHISTDGGYGEIIQASGDITITGFLNTNAINNYNQGVFISKMPIIAGGNIYLYGTAPVRALEISLQIIGTNLLVRGAKIDSNGYAIPDNANAAAGGYFNGIKFYSVSTTLTITPSQINSLTGYAYPVSGTFTGTSLSQTIDMWGTADSVKQQSIGCSGAGCQGVILTGVFNAVSDITYVGSGINGILFGDGGSTNSQTSKTGKISITGTGVYNGIWIYQTVIQEGSCSANCPNSSGVITSGTPTTTGGTFTSEQSAIYLNGFQTTYNSTYAAVMIGYSARSTAATDYQFIYNYSNGGDTTIIANTGNYYDPVVFINGPNAGAISVSAIGASAAVIAGGAGTPGPATFNQYSNAGVFISSSNNGNVTPPTINNYGSGNVMIGAGTYLASGVGTGGQITASSFSQVNQLASTKGLTYLYSGNPTNTTGLSSVSSTFSTQNSSNAIVGQASGSGNTAFTSLPQDTVAAYNTTPLLATSTKPVVYYRVGPNWGIELSSNSFSKVYGTDDSSALSTFLTGGGLYTTANYTLTNSSTGAVTTFNKTAGNFTFSFGTLSYTYTTAQMITGLSASSPSLRASYGTVAGEQVNTSTGYNYSGLSASSLIGGTIIPYSTATTPAVITLNEKITQAPLTITYSVTTNTYDGSSTYASFAGTPTAATLINKTVDGILLTDTLSSYTANMRAGSSVGSGATLTGVAQAGTFNAIASGAVIAGIGVTSTNNYNISYVGAVDTVNKAPLAITVLGNYNGSTSFTNSNSTIAVAGLVGSDVGNITVTGVTVSNSNVSANGSNYVSSIASSTGSNAANISNYLINTGYQVANSGILAAGASNVLSPNAVTINTLPIVITGANNTVSYSGVSQTNNGATVSINGGSASTISSTTISTGIGSQSITLNGYATGTNSGTYSDSFSLSPGSGTTLSNYAVSYTNGGLTINPLTGTITVTANSSTVFYNGSTQAVSGYTISGLTGVSSLPGITATGASGINVGSYTNTVSGTNSNFSHINFVQGALTINQAPLMMTANNAGTFIGVAPTTTTGQYNSLTYTLSGLVGSDTAATAISGPSVSVGSGYSATSSGASLYTGVLVPTATSSNYTLTFVNGNLTVAPAGSPIITVGTTSKIYGTYNNTNINASSSAVTVTAAYCSNCALTNASPTIIPMTATAPTSSSTTWTLTDIYSNYPTYTVTLAPTVTNSNYSTGNNLKVGTYAMAPSELTLTTGTTNFSTGYTPTYISGTLSITPFIIDPSGGSGGSSGSNSSAPKLNATANNRVYDTSTAATGTLTPTNFGSDSVTVNYGAANFASPNVVTNGTVSFTGITFGGADAANYSVLPSTNATATANITAAPLTIKQDSISKVYNATTQSGLTTYTQSGLLTGDSISSFNTNTAGSVKNVGTYNGSLAGATGTGLTNYNIAYVPGTLSITPFIIDPSGNGGGSGGSDSNAPKLTAAANDKIYDKTTAATGTLGPTNLFSGDNLTASYSTANFATSNVVTGGTVTFTGITLSGTSASNYAILTAGTATASANITPAPVTISGLSANNKVYDRTTVATLSGSSFLVTSGLLGTDTATVSGSPSGSGTFASINVGNGISVTPTFTGLAISNSNYYINGVSSALTASITPAPMYITGGLSANNKVYDTTTVASVAVGTPTLSGRLGGDVVAVQNTNVSNTSSFVFSQSHVGTGLAVTAPLVNGAVTGMSLNNANYYLAGINLSTPLTANITPRALTLSGLSANDKLYDTTSVATISSGNASLVGVVGSDIGTSNVTLNTSSTYTGSFSQSNVGTGLAVTLASGSTTIAGQAYTTVSGISISGSSAGNYYVSSPTAALSASITPASLRITASNEASFVTQSASPVNYSVNGLLGSDTVSSATTAALTALTAGSAIGTGTGAGGYVTTVSAAQGTGLSNYTISYIPGIYTVVPAGQLLVSTSGVSTIYGTAASFASPTVSYLSTSGAVISNLILTGSTTTGGVTSYSYADGAGASLSFTLTPSGSNIRSTADQVKVGTYGLSATDFIASGSPNITSTTAVVTGNLNVTAKPVTITATATSVVYDALAKTQGSTNTGLVTGDLVTVSGLATGTNAGSYNANVLASGADAPNYAFTYINNPLVITPLTLTVGGSSGTRISAAANDKVYDTTTAATGSLTVDGLLGSDSLTASYSSANFGSASVGSGTVTFSGVSLLGASASNYVISMTAPITASASITPASLRIVGSLTSSTFTNQTQTNTYTTSGLLGSDTVDSVQGSATRLRAGNTNDILGTAAGRGISNYTITYENGSLTITPKRITATVTPTGSAISGNTILDNTTTLFGIIPGTNVLGSTILNVSGNAGIQNITNQGTVLSGSNAGDYELISSNLETTSSNQVSPLFVLSGNGGGTINVAHAPSSINSGAITNTINVPPETVKPAVINPNVISTVFTNSNINSVSFVSFGNPEVGNVVFKVTQANGAPLPDWVKVDPLTNILTVADVPEAKNSNLTITIQKLVNGKLKKEARVLVNGSASSTE